MTELTVRILLCIAAQAYIAMLVTESTHTINTRPNILMYILCGYLHLSCRHMPQYTQAWAQEVQAA